jgi:flagellar biosynthesis/type III secretory pathway M-ring protein FliF/YscJ
MSFPFGNQFDEGNDDHEKVRTAKSKMITDFGLAQPSQERVTIKVLQQLIKEKPEKISRAIRKWLHPD